MAFMKLRSVAPSRKANDYLVSSFAWTKWMAAASVGDKLPFRLQ